MSDLFEEKSKDWDGNELIKQLSSAVGASILEHVPLHERMQVMDFGAGTGLICSQIAQRVEKITAVDISEAMLEKLAAKPELRDKVETVCQDIVKAPLEYRFDLIVSAMAMHHIEDTHLLVRRFAEHAKPGALVALADLDKEDGSFHPEGTEGVHHHGFERAALQEILEECGFKTIRFFTAHTIQKEERSYPVFLVTAEKQNLDQFLPIRYPPPAESLQIEL
ncbi:MAG TPA: class I SAM-dependent methyltransferase [Gammaproteobacteria bacterium]|nr:class I SAM-dependent methyltransferase [Gammaproteobacteria bacterium]